jgi:hypothetical protein
MAATAIAAIGLGISAFSTVKGMQAGKKQEAATQRGYDAQERIAESNATLSREVSGITKYQEKVRRQITQMEATKARRQIIRQTQLARATAISRASAAGASTGSSIQGVMAGVSSDFASQINEVRGNLRNSMIMFDTNAEIVDAQNRNAQRTGVFNSQLATAQSQASSAASQGNFYGQVANVGGTLAQNAGKITDVGKSFGGLFE